MVNTFVLILERGCLDCTWRRLFQRYPAHSQPICAWHVFLNACDHKSVRNRIVQGRNSWSIIPLHRHTKMCLVCPVVQTNRCCDDDTGGGWEDKSEDKDTISKEMPSKVTERPTEAKKPQPFLFVCCTPLRPPSLVAHLRKTSVPPHDAEPCVTLWL